MERQLTMGSLFDGIGGFMLAAQACGIIPVWAAEIEPNCISITSRHFPEVMHVGSVTELKGDEVPPVDIITFGSPCQNLSVAGNRKGLAGEESGLFLEAIRIIEEMRESTNGVYPAFIIWENVPGAFSSNDRQDFRTVLEKITKARIPLPKSEWTRAGMVRGGTVDTAWRTFNAEYWGVPQRRRRIYLVGDFGGQRAGEILFKPEGLLGYLTQGAETGTEAAGNAGNGAYAEGDGKGCLTPWDYQAKRIYDETSVYPALQAGSKSGTNQVAVLIRDKTAAGFTYKAGAKARGIGWQEGVAPTIKTDNSAGVLIETERFADVVLNDQGGDSINVEKTGVCPTLKAQAHGNLPCVVKEVIGLDITHADDNVAPAMLQRMGTGGNQVPLIAETIKENVMPIRSEASRLKESSGLGIGEPGKAAPTLTASDIHGVFYEEKKYYELQQFGKYRESKVTETLLENKGKRSDEGVVVKAIRQALRKVKYIIRRLTPRECERLQGYPDDWTRWGADGEEISDMARYRATGNSIAVPCAIRVFRGIISELEVDGNGG